jgi:hypothetical protein
MREAAAKHVGRSGKRALGLICCAIVLLLGSGCGREMVRTVDMDDALQRGREAMAAMRFEDASRHYADAFAVVGRDDRRWAEALYGYALALSSTEGATQRETRIATDLMRAVGSGSAQHMFGSAARLWLARQSMLEYVEEADAEAFAAAELELRRVMENPHSGDLAHHAALRLGELFWLRLEDPDSLAGGMDFLADWLARHPYNPYATLQWELLGYMRLYHGADKGLALDAFLQAEAGGFPRLGTGGGTHWTAALLAEELGRTGDAIRLYRGLLVWYPSSGYGWMAEQALRRLGGADVSMAAVEHASDGDVEEMY